MNECVSTAGRNTYFVPKTTHPLLPTQQVDEAAGACGWPLPVV